MATKLVVTQLEEYLRLWEDYWYCRWLLAEVEKVAQTGEPAARVSPDGPAYHFREFREWLLGVHQRGGTSGIERFIDLYIFDDQREMRDFPKALAAWSLDSRRVYSLSPEVQAILSVTSLKEVKWDDVPLPFDSFAIALGTPYTDETGCTFDTVLISRYDAPLAGSVTPVFEVRLLVKPETAYSPITSQEKGLAQRRLRRGRPADYTWIVRWASRRWGEVAERFPSHACFLNQTRMGGWLVTESVKKVGLVSNLNVPLVDSGDTSGSDFMMRIIAGLPLYLRSLPSESPHRGQWVQPPRGQSAPSAAIVDQALVCAVSSNIELSPDEREFLGLDGDKKRQAGYELGWHFREAYWRRPRGKGDDPTWPKTERVRHSIVRQDRMPPDAGLPEGKEKKT